MFNISIDTTAGQQLMDAMRKSIEQFCSRGMPEAFTEWQSDDMNRKRPSVEQPQLDTVETKIRGESRGAEGWRWWEDQEREPRGIPEGGEFMSFPEGHWRLQKRRRRRAGRARRGLAATIKARALKAARRRAMRIVTPSRIRRFRRMRRLAALPVGRLLERRVRRLARVGRGRAVPRVIRRITGVRPVMRPQLGARLGQRMTRAMIRNVKWR